MNNLAADRNNNSALIIELNTMLNNLITHEIGEDSGTYIQTVIDGIEAAKPPIK